MPLLGSLIAAAPLIQAGGSFLGGATSALGMGKNMSQADQLGMQFDNSWTAYKRSLLKGPSMEMAGLKAAGINPLYRYGQHGTPSGMMSFGGGGAHPYNRFGDLGGAIGDMASSAVDVFRSLSEADKAKSESTRNYAELERISADIARLESLTGLTNVQRDHELDKQKHTLAEITTEYARAALLRAQSQVPPQQIREMQARINQLDQHAALMLSETQLNQFRQLVVKAEAMEDLTDAQRYMYVMNTWAGYLFGGAGDLLSSFNPIK